MQDEHRNLLIATIPGLFGQQQVNFKNHLKTIGEGAVLDEVVENAPFNQLATTVVDLADQRGWIRKLVDSLATKFPRPELTAVLAGLDDEKALVPTTENPFNEVLLASNRPFVDRRSLRNAFLSLVAPDGETVLLVDGTPKSGKTFSYHLLNHAASQRGFIVHRVHVKRVPTLPEIATTTLNAVGFFDTLPEQGVESAERWAEKLATVVADTVRKAKLKRIFVFDEFPPQSPVKETLSFVSRLARFADEELRDVVRVVLIRFPGELDPEVEDVAVRDNVQPFTTTDMIAAVMQIAVARKWEITE